MVWEWMCHLKATGIAQLSILRLLLFVGGILIFDEFLAHRLSQGITAPLTASNAQYKLKARKTTRVEKRLNYLHFSTLMVFLAFSLYCVLLAVRDAVIPCDSLCATNSSKISIPPVTWQEKTYC